MSINKTKTLEKLINLRNTNELNVGFPDIRSCLSWAAKVEPLLSFNLVYKVNFNMKLQKIHQILSTYSIVQAPQELVTILEMGIEQLKHELESDTQISQVKLVSALGNYVHQSRIKELTAINSKKFDLTKLIQLCKELNISHIEGNFFSIIMLCRAIIDHIPPIFEVKNFQELANNYAGTKSFKDSMERLNNSSRKIADQHLHTHIRSSEVLPNITQVDFSNDLDILFSEIVRVLKQS